MTAFDALHVFSHMGQKAQASLSWLLVRLPVAIDLAGRKVSICSTKLSLRTRAGGAELPDCCYWHVISSTSRVTNLKARSSLWLSPARPTHPADDPRH